jgi:hypothetical protein
MLQKGSTLGETGGASGLLLRQELGESWRVNHGQSVVCSCNHLEFFVHTTLPDIQVML